VPQAWSPRDAALQWNWAFWEKVLRPLVHEIGDNGPLAPALVAPNASLPIRVEGAGAESIEFLARETDDALFILACKREGSVVNVKFTGLPPGAATAEVLFESPRKVEAKNGAFSDWFAPFDVHLYRFPRP
jgi:hypothetical protein